MRETGIIIKELEKAGKVELIENIFQICFDSKKWVKWFPKNYDATNNKKEIIKASCHYIFSNDSFIDIKSEIDDIDNVIQSNLKRYIKTKLKLIEKAKDENSYVPDWNSWGL